MEDKMKLKDEPIVQRSKEGGKVKKVEVQFYKMVIHGCETRIISQKLELVERKILRIF